MAEDIIAEITRVCVTDLACPRVMARGWVVAGDTVSSADEGVVEGRNAEAACVRVAGPASSRVMAGGRVMAGDAVAIPDEGVVEGRVA
ncbi:MAG: hypothetical protein ACE5E7_11525, partial [Anaerolineae bacterium]